VFDGGPTRISVPATPMNSVASRTYMAGDSFRGAMAAALSVHSNAGRESLGFQEVVQAAKAASAVASAFCGEWEFEPALTAAAAAFPV
jgi:hypothetical protein